MVLQILFLVSFGGAFITYILGKFSSKIRDFFAVFISVVLLGIIIFLYGKFSENIFYKGFFDIPLILRINPLCWFFAISIQIITTLSIIFSLGYMEGREKLDFYYFMMLLVNAGMLGIVLSGDLLSFYIFWEIMSWSAFLLISYNRGSALAAGMKYIIMSIIGSVCMLTAILSLYAGYKTLVIPELVPFLTVASSDYILFLLILFFTAFGIKNALMPLHTWLPDAHSEAPAPFSAVLSGILIKMGTFGFILFIYAVVGLRIFMYLGGGNFHYVLSLLAGITIIVPTFIALLQDDAKRLLAWSSIAQAGYIILGITIGTRLGFIGGMFHFFNHAIFKALLFLSIGAVEYKTGIRDLNSLGGLIKKMPIAFFGALIGIFGLMGIPLTNGFVSKWLIYKTLILEKHPFLAFIALFGTWGTILYSYKLLHNIFLGQLPEKFEHIKKIHGNMRFSIILLSCMVVVFGILPGIPLKAINSIGVFFGFESLRINVWGITSETETLSMVNIFIAVLIATGIVWILFRAGYKKVNITQEDNYAAGAHISRDKYHYTADFYNPLCGMIKPYLKDFSNEFYSVIIKAGRILSDRTRKIYSGDLSYYVLYIVLFLGFLIILKIGLKLW